MKIFFCALVFLCGLTCFATMQTPDIIRHNFNDSYTNIYESTLDAHNNLNLPLEVYYEKFPQRRPFFGINSSACWRGYVAEYMISSDNKLYLTNVKKRWYSISAKKVMGYECEYPVFCDWFSIDNWRVGSASDFEYKKISVKNGIVDYEIEEFGSDWYSTSDMERRAGLLYSPQNDNYNNWHTLMELSSPQRHLSKDDYFKLYDGGIFKTRGLVNFKDDRLILFVPETIKISISYIELKNDDKYKNFDGKSVECEIRFIKNDYDLRGYFEVLSMRELSKSESIHKNVPISIDRNYFEVKDLETSYVHRGEAMDISKIDFSKLKFKLEEDGPLFIFYNADENIEETEFISKSGFASSQITEIFSKNGAFKIRKYISPEKIGGKYIYNLYIGDKKVWEYEFGKNLYSDIYVAEDEKDFDYILSLIPKTKESEKILNDAFYYYFVRVEGGGKIYSFKLKKLYDILNATPDFYEKNIDRFIRNLDYEIFDVKTKIKIAKIAEKKTDKFLPLAHANLDELHDPQTLQKLIRETTEIYKLEDGVYKLISAKNIEEKSQRNPQKDFAIVMYHIDIVKKYFPQNCAKIIKEGIKYYKENPEFLEGISLDSLLLLAQNSTDWEDKIFFAKAMSKELSNPISESEIEKTKGNSDAFKSLINALIKNKNDRTIDYVF